MNVIPGDDILHARSHGGTDGEDKALFKGPAQQAQHAVPLRAVREVGHAVCSGIPNTWVGVFWLVKRRQLIKILYSRNIQSEDAHVPGLLTDCRPGGKL